MKLIAHPAHAPGGVEGVEVAAELRRGPSTLTWRVAGEAPAFAPRAAPLRTDELWKRTCFEMFIRPGGGEDYVEFNFSPSTEWAAYSFHGYRAEMADLPIAAPVIEPTADGVRVSIDLSGLPAGEWQVGLTAVIEEEDGTKSFWAFAHPSPEPDFHHPDCFVLELPALV